jgi:NADH:ubiquinone reductase (H+-translocating)
MHIVVVGGGFGGVKAALELSKRQIGKITLVSDEPYFLHHATLYATATGKNDAESVIPLETIFANHPNVHIVLDKVEHLDPDRRIVNGKKQSYHYDKLVLALGSVTTFFNLPGLGKHAYGIKSLHEINRFQEHMHEEIVQKKLDKEYFVIGAGPTGVELAAALNEYLKAIKHLYRLKNTGSRVTLVEAAPRILPTMSKTASSLVARQLKKQNIRVLVDHKVESMDDDSIIIQGKDYPTTTAIWTSGVANSPFFARNHEHFTLAPNGRVKVNAYLEALDDVYVIGDNGTADPHHMALPAMRQATHVAKNITRLATNQVQLPYRSRKVPVSLPVGETWGYVEWHGIYADGHFGAWLRRRIELRGYLRLMPKKVALPIWRAHHLNEVDY